MKITRLVAGLLLVLPGTPALAQTVPDDVRCLVLSGLFAKSSTTTEARESAGKALLFFMGRVDGRANQAAIVTAMRGLGGQIDPKEAPAQMSTCASRVAQSQRMFQAADAAARPAPKK